MKMLKGSDTYRQCVVVMRSVFACIIVSLPCIGLDHVALLMWILSFWPLPCGPDHVALCV